MSRKITCRRVFLLVFAVLFSCTSDEYSYHAKEDSRPTNYYQPPVPYPPAAPPPVYYVPVPAYSYPGSRYYANPYDIPASPYPGYYDSDQYYVAPNRYRNVEERLEVGESVMPY